MDYVFLKADKTTMRTHIGSPKFHGKTDSTRCLEPKLPDIPISLILWCHRAEKKLADFTYGLVCWFPDTLMQNLHLADFTCGGGWSALLAGQLEPDWRREFALLAAGALLLLLPLSAARTALTLLLLLGAYTGTAPLLSLWCNGPLLVRCSYAPHSGGW